MYMNGFDDGNARCCDKLVCNGILGFELTEEDFYPPQDCRFYASGVEDIEGGDCFCEYAEYFWEAYGREIYDDADL